MATAETAKKPYFMKQISTRFPRKVGDKGSTKNWGDSGHKKEDWKYSKNETILLIHCFYGQI